MAAPLASIAVVVAPQAAVAQRAPEPSKEIRLDLLTRYDENVARSSDALAAQRGLNGSDVILSPMLTLDIEHPFGPHRAGITGQVGYDFYRRNTQLNRERINLDANGDLRVGPCFVSPRVRFSRRQSDLGDLAVLGGGFLNIKNTETVQTYGSELACGRDQGLRPVVGYEYERGHNSSFLREQSDYHSNLYSAGLRYVGPTIGIISIYARRRDTDFDGLPVPGFGADSYRTTEFGVSYSRNIGSRYKVSGSVGRTKVESRNPLISDRSGLTWNLRGTALIGTRLQVSLDTVNEFRNNLSSDAAVNRLKSYGIAADYALTDALRFNASARIEKQTRDYGFVPPPGTLLDDRRRLYRVGATYDFGRRTRFGLFAGREERNGNGTLYDYNANNVGMSVGVKF